MLFYLCIGHTHTHTHTHTCTHTHNSHMHSLLYYTGQCQSMAAEIQQLNASLSRYLVPGASCIGQTVRGRRFNDGYCDQLHRCREIDPDDAFVTQLLNLLSQYTSVAEWMRDMWWVVVLACIGALVVLSMIVTICHFSLRKVDSMESSKGNKSVERGRRKGKMHAAHKSHRTRVIPLHPRGARVGPAN